MNERCTCGAVLPPDARFCHKCGKPQYDELHPEPETEPVPPAVPAIAVEPAGPPPIDFHNFAAVRVGFITALIIFMLNVIPLPVPLVVLRSILMPLAAGFLAVYLYHRWTGLPVTLRGGVSLGWITGIFSFMIAMILFTMLVLVLTQPEALEMLRQKVGGENRGELEKLVQVFHNPEELGPALASGIFGLFVTCTLLPVLGGALGAKVLEKD